MEKRLPFILGDLAANCLIATICVAFTSWLIGGSWGMVPGMLVGMLLGMVLAMPLSLAGLTPWLGVMEVVTPCMLSGMFGGMWGGMWDLSGAEIIRWGMSTGATVVVVIYLLNALLSGPQRVES